MIEIYYLNCIYNIIFFNNIILLKKYNNFPRKSINTHLTRNNVVTQQHVKNDNHIDKIND